MASFHHELLMSRRRLGKQADDHQLMLYNTRVYTHIQIEWEVGQSVNFYGLWVFSRYNFTWDYSLTFCQCSTALQTANWFLYCLHSAQLHSSESCDWLTMNWIFDLCRYTIHSRVLFITVVTSFHKFNFISFISTIYLNLIFKLVF